MNIIWKKLNNINESIGETIKKDQATDRRCRRAKKKNKQRNLKCRPAKAKK